MLTEEGFLAICSEAKGLQGLAHDLHESEIRITPVPPGHVSTYSLDKFGKASLVKDKQFQYPGKPPQFTTEITTYSRSMCFIQLQFVIYMYQISKSP